VIRSSFDHQTHEATIVLQPNHSWTWRANLYLIASLFVISISVGFVMLWLGYWMILLFTTLEIVVLTACLHYCVKRTHQQQVLRLSPERLIVESGTRKPEQRINIHRFFAKFFIYPATQGHAKKSVALRYQDTNRNQELEIGKFLGDAEKDHLIHLLNCTIIKLDRLPTGG